MSCFYTTLCVCDGNNERNSKELFLRFPQKFLPIKVFRHCFGFIEPKYEKKVTEKKEQMECRMGGQLDGQSRVYRILR